MTKESTGGGENGDTAETAAGTAGDTAGTAADTAETRRHGVGGNRKPITHPVARAPMPTNYGFSFFDPADLACQAVLTDPSTTVAQLFAVVRQWVPQVQQRVELIGEQMLLRDFNVNDRDGLTDMTLLHYACKAGAQGVGCPEAAGRLAQRLLSLGADPSVRCRWTDMNALHYAAYFDSPVLVRVLARSANPPDLNAPCVDVDGGTALHVAASNLCVSAVKSLLEHGADPSCRNSRGQVAAEAVPPPSELPLDLSEGTAASGALRRLLLEAMPLVCPLPRATLHNHDNVLGSALMGTLGLQLGQMVALPGGLGWLRFLGPAEFASGQWVGVELLQPLGKNNGTVGGHHYFSCPAKHGVFVPVSHVSKLPSDEGGEEEGEGGGVGAGPRGGGGGTGDGGGAGPAPCLEQPRVAGGGRPPSKRGRARERLRHGLRRWGSVSSAVSPCLRVGCRVSVSPGKTGTVRFYGKTSLAPGRWCGVELDHPVDDSAGNDSAGNDSAAGGGGAEQQQQHLHHHHHHHHHRYFSCSPGRGVFVPASRVRRLDDAAPLRIPSVATSNLTGRPCIIHLDGKSPKELISKSPMGRLLFCCWFPWMVKGKVET
uniref:CAP-Gly domain-containing linker protein 3-like isoform X2 n=1 Tax=Petromyzon marinus TaxID=7757 RepID=A0AAJ7SJC3_PETMA|nr:CAP-Gly domain-containing linker protein 3-like isoform X2 [Petromyzon marinus]